jgi:hypothetical protein
MNHNSINVNPKVLNVLARQQNDLVMKPPDGNLTDKYLRVGVLFIVNQDGDVLDIQADIIGPGNLNLIINL